jgi:hypothetical protein
MRPPDRRRVRRQRGIAAIELALMMPVLITMLVFPLYLGRLFWHYTVMQHAAHDAARYVSNAPASEMSNQLRAVEVAQVGEAIIDKQLSELAPGELGVIRKVNCDAVGCVGGNRPVTVRVGIRITVQDIFFPGQTWSEITLDADVSYPYIGR